MTRIITALALAATLAGCGAQNGELSERRSNCFGKLQAGPDSDLLVAVPKS